VSKQLKYDVASGLGIGDTVMPSERMTPQWVKIWNPGGAKIESICVGFEDNIWFYMEGIPLPFQAHELELVHKSTVLERIVSIWK
jgi:hypothetical protein